MMAAEEGTGKKVWEEWPLHWAVWHNDLGRLEQELSAVEDAGDDAAIERKDPRGRTPLMLAVSLGHMEAAQCLLRHNADANAENNSYWTVSHEATATGDPEILRLILKYREYQRHMKTRDATANLLRKLRDTADFYAEMNWELSSWVPFVSKVCPSDTYKIYKRGSSVRIDTTLVGFDASHKWERGNQSILFKASPDGKFGEITVVDHDQKEVISGERLRAAKPTDSAEAAVAQEGSVSEEELTLNDFEPTEMDIASRLTAPIATTYVDVNSIAFERAKSGFLAWKSDREEDVNGYHCKVFGASNVELVTKTRTEHMTERDKAETDNRNSTPLDSLLKFVQGTEVKHEDKVAGDQSLVTGTNPFGIRPEDYLNSFVDLGGHDVGRPKQVSRRSQAFKATLWLSDSFPLSLQEQITPIIDLMAASNAHFARLKNFIELQLPAGFPVKIEIPLFHVINARITFGNINGLVKPVQNVSMEPVLNMETGETENFTRISPEVFEIPPSYAVSGMIDGVIAPSRPSRGAAAYGGMGFHHDALAEEDMLLQFAIQQSLMSAEGAAPTAGGESFPREGSPFDLELQRALDASLRLSGDQNAGPPPPLPNPSAGREDELGRVLELSRREEEERQLRLAEEEEEAVRKAIELSLLEK